MIRKLVFAAIGLPFLTTSVFADEGMWQPHQLPQLKSQLTELGLGIDPQQLSSLDQFPMNAIVSLGGCSASFVSPKGLVVTNHHCVYGSIAYNSTTENNILKNGFLAKSMTEEMPAAPGSRVYVTEQVSEVTSDVLNGVAASKSGIENYKQIEANQKSLIKECEATNRHRCNVVAFHHGLQYFLIKRLEIKDVRLVYAPADSIGKYGGDIDNWQWPRHTGDFGFYRAYVSKEGNPDEFSEDNVPYQPASFLKISNKELNEGDFVMALGYPGSTNRYRTGAEVEHEFTWYYPEARKYRLDIISAIESASEAESQARLNYASEIASLNNYAKNFLSMQQSFRSSDFLQRRQKEESDLATWLEDNNAAESSKAISAMNTLISAYHENAPRDLWRSYINYVDMVWAGGRLYRLALEKQKPDAEREPGYQERDLQRFRQSMQRMSNAYDDTVDKAKLDYLLARHAELSNDLKLDSVAKAFPKHESPKARTKLLDKLYKKTKLNEEAVRLSWMEKTPEEFRKSKDPFIQIAIALYDERMKLEMEDKEASGQMKLLRPKYMQALIDYKRAQGLPIYADANSTLRVTVGQVKGNQPKDGLRNLPFTTLEGILEKDTGETPFDSPKKQLDLIRKKDYGNYKSEKLGTVPVNFLNTLDITGGNSGSATLNANGELVGLLFDGVYESIIGDWDFNDEKNRAISVDSRYMLWVMDKIDNADNLLNEMTIAE